MNENCANFLLCCFLLSLHIMLYFVPQHHQQRQQQKKEEMYINEIDFDTTIAPFL